MAINTDKDDEVPEPVKKVVNQNADVIASHEKELISLRTELKDLRDTIKDVAKEGAKAAIVELFQQEGVNVQPQTNQVQVSAQPTATASPVLGLNKETLDSANALLTTLKAIYQPTDATQEMSIFNEKRLAQIGVRYLNLLLMRADKDLIQLEKAAGVPSDSVLHEVV